MLESEAILIVGFTIVLVFSLLGNLRGKPPNPIA